MKGAKAMSEIGFKTSNENAPTEEKFGVIIDTAQGNYAYADGREIKNLVSLDLHIDKAHRTVKLELELD